MSAIRSADQDRSAQFGSTPDESCAGLQAIEKMEPRAGIEPAAVQKLVVARSLLRKRAKQSCAHLYRRFPESSHDSS